MWDGTIWENYRRVVACQVMMHPGSCKVFTASAGSRIIKFKEGPSLKFVKHPKKARESCNRLCVYVESWPVIHNKWRIKCWCIDFCKYFTYIQNFRLIHEILHKYIYQFNIGFLILTTSCFTCLTQAWPCWPTCYTARLSLTKLFSAGRPSISAWHQPFQACWLACPLAQISDQFHKDMDSFWRQSRDIYL